MKAKMISAPSSPKGAKGQTQVEFALTMVFIMLLTLSLIQLIAFIHTYNVLADSAKEGVRYAIVHGCDLSTANCSGTCALACTDAGGANVKTWVQGFAKASLHDTSAMTINVNYVDATSNAPNRVRVTVSYPYQPFFGFSWPSVNVQAAAEGRIVF